MNQSHQFPNGARLVLELSSGEYAFPLGKLEYFQLTYLEKDTEAYGTKDKPAYLFTQTEYFAPNEAETALKAFQLRLESKPSKACGLGYSLGDVKARS